MNALTGRIGINSTTKHIQNRFFWYRTVKDITTYVSECDNCQKVKNKKIKVKTLHWSTMNLYQI